MKLSSSRAIIAASTFLAMLYVFAVMHIPISLFAEAPHDDTFFFAKAQSLWSFDWLGPYSQMTLIKGNTYTFFLAINALTGLPITLTTAIFFAFSNIFFSWTLYLIHGRKWLFGLVLVLALLNPALFPTRVIRDAIYAPETLLLLAAALQLSLLATTPASRRLWGVAAGIGFAAFWYTREEGVWIVPALMLLVAIQIWRDRSRWHGVAIAVSTAVVLLVGIATVNYIRYEAFVVVEITSNPFKSTLSLLQTVEAGMPVSKVPVPKAVREQLYKESPSFAELQPYFETYGTWWTAPGCHVYPQTCGDFAGGWFMWALRDAVAWAGHYKTASEAADFYRRLGNEVEDACREGRLTCQASIIPFLPRIPMDDLRDVPRGLVRVVDLLLASGSYQPRPSQGLPSDIRRDEWFLGNPLRYPTNEEKALLIAGWYVDKDDSWLKILCGQGKPPADVDRLASPDLSKQSADNGASRNRFHLALDSKLNECDLHLVGAPGQVSNIPVEELKEGENLPSNDSDAHLYIDKIDSPNSMSEWDSISTSINIFRVAYSFVIKCVLAASLITIIIYGIFFRDRLKRERDVIFVSLILLIAILTRSMIIILVDITAFPAISDQYASAMFPLFTTMICLPLALLGRGRFSSGPRAAAQPEAT